MHRVVIPLMLVVVACRPAATKLSDEQRAAVAAEVNAVNAEYWKAWSAADWDRGMAYYVDSPDFVWAAGGVVSFGKSTLEGFRSRFASVKSQAFTFRDSRTIVMAPDAASVTGTGTWIQVDTAGTTVLQREFAWTGVWILRDGAWKLHLAHLSYPVPASWSGQPDF